MTALTPKQQQYLRGLAHHLQPVVQLGHAGLNEAVIAAVDDALGDHELIKVKFGQNFPEDRRLASAALASATSSQLCQTLGRTAVFYRPAAKPEQRRIRLPEVPK